MTKVGIMSDTHGYTELIDEVLAALEPGHVDLWLHAGDLGDDGRYLQDHVEVPVYLVRGNNDRGSHLEAQEQLIPLEDTFIYMTHGHRVDYFNYVPELLYLGHTMGARLVVAGHTHIHRVDYKENQVFVNPGSLALPRDGSKGTFAIVTYDQGNFDVDFISLDQLD